MQLQPEEPAAGPWRLGTTRELAARLRAVAGDHVGRPAVVAIDGRGGSGKSTLAHAVAGCFARAAVLGTDDIAWNEPFFEWGPLLRKALEELHGTGALHFTPPAWPAHERAGSLTVEAGRQLVVVEGVGAAQQCVADLLDAVVWVQSDDGLAEQRGIERDITLGVNGDEVETVAFWHEWMGHERPFQAQQRPWERADLVVAGTPVSELADGELAWVHGPLPT